MYKRCIYPALFLMLITFLVATISYIILYYHDKDDFLEYHPRDCIIHGICKVDKKLDNVNLYLNVSTYDRIGYYCLFYIISDSVNLTHISKKYGHNITCYTGPDNIITLSVGSSQKYIVVIFSIGLALAFFSVLIIITIYLYQKKDN